MFLWKPDTSFQNNDKMKVEYIAYFFSLLICFVKPCPSTKLAGKELAYNLLQDLLQKDIDNPIWEKKYGDMSKVYIKIFKRNNFQSQQKFSLKNHGDEIVDNLKENGFDPDFKTKIITHGYIDDGIIFLNAFAEAYEKKGKNNKFYVLVSLASHQFNLSFILLLESTLGLAQWSFNPH